MAKSERQQQQRWQEDEKQNKKKNKLRNCDYDFVLTIFSICFIGIQVIGKASKEFVSFSFFDIHQLWNVGGWT